MEMKIPVNFAGNLMYRKIQDKEHLKNVSHGGGKIEKPSGAARGNTRNVPPPEIEKIVVEK